MLVRFGSRFVGALTLGFLLSACGSDDDKGKEPPVEQESEGGAPTCPPGYPPAITEDDCQTSVWGLQLSQPTDAAVWGGLVVLDFTADNESLDAFDVQLYDPALGAWTNNYVNVQALGQRSDGSYFIAVSPYFSDVTQDSELKLRVRPSQSGCPDAEWTESATFTASDPLIGTTWTGEVPAASLSGQLTLQRNELPSGAALPSTRVVLGDSTLTVEFGSKGAVTETVSIPLSTEKDLPWDGCTLALTFSGTYSIKLRPQYGGVTANLSDLRLTDFEATTCDSPALSEMNFAAEDVMTFLPAQNQQLSINYLPTLYAEPGKPVWQSSNFGQVFQQLPQLLAYTLETEGGYGNGYVYPQDLTLTQE